MSRKKRTNASLPSADIGRLTVERIQTGIRMEKRLYLVLKALAGTLDLSLGDLLEGIVLHAFEGKRPFGPDSLEKLRALRSVYGLDLTAADSHRLLESGARSRKAAASSASGGQRRKK